jgi:hypothetical protein
MLMRSRADGRASTPVTPATLRSRWPSLLAAAASVVTLVAAYLIPHHAAGSQDARSNLLENLLLAVQALTFAAVGVVVLWSHPGHRIGRLFSAVGLIVSGYLFVSRYQYYALVERPDLDLPLGELAAWLQAWSYVPALVIVIMLLPQLFPNGHLVSRRWRPAFAVSLLGSVLMILTDMLRPGRLDDITLRNPTGIDPHLHAILDNVGVSFFLGCALLGFLSLVARWRSAGLHERQQLKVFFFVAAMMPLFVAVNGVINTFGLRDELGWVSYASATVAFLGLPVAVGFSIVRHRLYDIDIVINRTVVYGLLSATLLATYVASVLLLQQVLDPFVGSSNVTVALSTLAVAALFRPARDHIQAVVDRRFFRRRYDGRRILEGFATRLRDEVDLDAVTDDLLATVRHSVQPTQVSLWVVPGVTQSRNDSRTPGP